MNISPNTIDSYDIVNIIPKEFVTVNIGTKVSFQVTGFKLNNSISILARIHDANDEPIQIHNFTIEGDEYFNWTDSDEYIVDLILNKLDLQKQT